MLRNNCPICLSSKLSKALYTDENALVSIAQIKVKPSLIPSNPIRLVQCLSCGLVFNNSFDSEKILPTYASDDYVVKSIVPGGMSRNMEFICQEIMPYVDFKSNVLEIGCGQADLSLALGKIVQSIVTIDPSVQINLKITDEILNHTHIRNYFDYEVAAPLGPFDLIVFRHLLEHIPSPMNFLDDIAKIVKMQGYVYMEVPNWDNIVQNKRFCDIFNDHRSYFQESTLVGVMGKRGFRKCKVIELYHGQHMGLFFQKTNEIEVFDKKLRIYDPQDIFKIQQEALRLNDILDRVSSIAVWGAGAHGQAILSSLSEGNIDKIKFYLDKDKNKIGRFIPNTHAQILFPTVDILKKGIDLVIISAVLHEAEIKKELVNNFQYGNQILTMGSGITTD